ncbi:DUF726-domain-containing protein [Eremomyces bilateralis CBS 781.70]|uniref:DUF726-domain-containing protein n=1 Tax=Eremomyces bilateralis CBS 781.70 TaxID=1392243 RepID=A0A6G1GFK0_9PEZI|nr:DUF726-domain-containing protein [Eremomyces bilateralis CBS 781.70]KAF1816804.1 DUF726-domain-containing protein [Eremomyces bilateralis CBS 781.70]
MLSFLKAPPASQNDGDSLSDLLPSPSLKVEFALLLLLSTDAMRKAHCAVFEPPERQEKQESHSLIDLDDGVPSRAKDGEAAVLAERSRELSSSAIQGIKRESLTYFDSWRSRVLKRSCEVLNVRPETVRQARKSYADRQAKVSKAKEEEDFMSWANGEEREVKQNLRLLPFDPIPTKLSTMSAEQKSKLVQSALLLLLSLESYTGHSRILLLQLAASLQVTYQDLVKYESDVAHLLLQAALAAHTNSNDAGEATARKWKVGLAAVAGAAVIGVTGGLAAPLLAAGISTVFGGLGLGAVSGLLGALAGNGVIIGALFGAYGAKMTGKMMDSYAKEVQDFKFVPLKPDTVNDAAPDAGEAEHHLRVSIGISGWINEESDITRPWLACDSGSSEAFALQWEVETLLRLGVSLNTVLKTYVWDSAKYEILRRTLLGSLAAGLWPLGLLKVASIVDNPFSVGKARADKAGKVLAKALLAKVQGERPVTLIGYSLGARLIYACLLELATQNAFGIIENVVLIGSPVPGSSGPWTNIRAIVTGRVVNVYNGDDLILGFLYRASSIQFGVAGLQPVKYVHGVENFDVCDIVDGHASYQSKIGKILEKIGWADLGADASEEKPPLPPRPRQHIVDDAQIRGEIESHLAVLENLHIDDAKKGVVEQATVQPGLSKMNAQLSVQREAPLEWKPHQGAPHNKVVSNEEVSQEGALQKGPSQKEESLKEASQKGPSQKGELLKGTSQKGESHEKVSHEKALPTPDARTSSPKPKDQDPTETTQSNQPSRTLDPGTFTASEDSDYDDESAGSDYDGEMAMLDPTPFEDDEETIQFGTGSRGFQLHWENN